MVKIELTNWMSHGSTVIELDDKVGFIVGSNGVGKTAVRDALEFVYLGTGHLRGIMKKSDLGQLGIRDGAKSCEVRLTVPGKTIRRTMKPNGQQRVYLREGEFDELQIPIGEADERLHGMAADAVRLCLEPSAWFTMGPQRQTELLVNATRSGAGDVEDILMVMKRFLEPDGPEDLGAIEGIAELIHADGFRAAEAKAVENRQVAGRARAELDTKPPSPEFGEIDLSKHTVEQHEGRLNGLRDQRQKAAVDHAAIVAAAKGKSEEAYAALQALLDIELPEVDESAGAVAEESQAALEAAAFDWSEKANLTIDANDALTAAEDLLEPPGIFHPGQCPHLPAMTCRVKLETFQRHAATVEKPTVEAIADLASKHADATAARDEAFEAMETAKNQAAVHLKAAGQAIADRQELNEHAARVDAAERRVAILDAGLKEVEAKAEEPHVEGEMTLEQLDEKIELGERVVHQKRSFDEAVQRHTTNAARYEALTAEHERWNAIAVELKPGGSIEKRAGDGASEPFMNALNSFSKLSGHIQLEPDMTIRVGPEKRHPSQLSTSQRLALGISIQNAFCELLRFPLLICDAVDLFDGRRRKAWLECALSVRPGYAGGVIGLATSTVDKVAPPPRGCTTFKLQPAGGSVEVEIITGT